VAAPSHGFEIAADREARASISNGSPEQGDEALAAPRHRRYAAPMTDPTTADDLRERARNARQAGRLDEAMDLLAAAAEADPGVAVVHHDLGILYRMVSRLDQAEASLREAMRLRPDDARTRHALGTVLMAQGRYRDGWPLYEARRDVPELGLSRPPLQHPEWQGEDLAGRSLVILPEQGLGDQIQYARFAPWLAAKGAKVTLICLPPLRRLFAANLGVEVIGAEGRISFAPPDYWVLTSSIVGRTGLDIEAIPNAPYLRADPHPQAAGRIGVVTRGSPQHANDAQRSLPEDAARELMSLPGALNLQPESLGARDFLDTASVIAGLDLVITVDTAVAHLAGAMGRPVWILLPYLMTDWRWMTGRADSPWYPSARLFRQPAPGDWGSVLAEVRAALAQR